MLNILAGAGMFAGAMGYPIGVVIIAKAAGKWGADARWMNGIGIGTVLLSWLLFGLGLWRFVGC